MPEKSIGAESMIRRVENMGAFETKIEVKNA
jgi:hypothetical protein